MFLTQFLDRISTKFLHEQYENVTDTSTALLPCTDTNLDFLLMMCPPLATRTSDPNPQVKHKSRMHHDRVLVRTHITTVDKHR